MEGHQDNVSLFYTPTSDPTVKSREWVEHRPVGQLSADAALEFSVSGNSSKYIDLRQTRLKIKLRILQGNGEKLPSSLPVDLGPVPNEAKVAPVNLFLQSMWKQVDVSLQQQVVSPNISTRYPYKSMIDVLLGYGEEAKRTQLQSQLYYKDQGNVSCNDSIEGTNSGLLMRAIYTEKSQYVDLEGPLYIDILETSRYVLNGVQVNFKLWPSSNEFKLMSSNPTADYKIDIEEAVLKVCMVEVAPEVAIAHAETLKLGPAKYYYTRSDIKTHAIAKGQWGCTLEDVYQGEVPQKLTVALVSSESFTGSYLKNPFNFKHYNCSFMGFYVDGKSVPAEPLSPSFTKKNFLSAYATTFGGDGYHTDFGHNISREDYPNGYSIFVFDLCLNNCERVNPQTMKKHTRLEVKFAEALPEPVTLIAYAKFPGLVEIDEMRHVKIV